MEPLELQFIKLSSNWEHFRKIGTKFSSCSLKWGERSCSSLVPSQVTTLVMGETWNTSLLNNNFHIRKISIWTMHNFWQDKDTIFFQDNLLWREKCRESGLLDSDIDHNLRYELRLNPNMVYSQRKVSSRLVQFSALLASDFFAKTLCMLSSFSPSPPFQNPTFLLRWDRYIPTSKLVKNESVDSDSMSRMATIRDSSRLESDDSIVIWVSRSDSSRLTQVGLPSLIPG